MQTFEHLLLRPVRFEWSFVLLQSQLLLHLILVEMFGEQAEQVAPAFNVKLLNDDFETFATLKEFWRLADHVFE